MEKRAPAKLTSSRAARFSRFRGVRVFEQDSGGCGFSIHSGRALLTTRFGGCILVRKILQDGYAVFRGEKLETPRKSTCETENRYYVGGCLIGMARGPEKFSTVGIRGFSSVVRWHMGQILKVFNVREVYGRRSVSIMYERDPIRS